MARSSECTEQYAQKVFDTADIVREAMFQQLRVLSASFSEYLGKPQWTHFRAYML